MITNMIRKQFWILHVFCWIISIDDVHNADPLVNMALNRPVTAHLTCGISGPERFISSARTGNAVTSEICYNTSSYRSENMVDGNDNTWWQSTSRISFLNNGYGKNGRPDADIFVDLQQVIYYNSGMNKMINFIVNFIFKFRILLFLQLKYVSASLSDLTKWYSTNPFHRTLAQPWFGSTSFLTLEIVSTVTMFLPPNCRLP